MLCHAPEGAEGTRLSLLRPGRRDFGEFIAEYAPPIPGRFLDVDSGAALGACPKLAALTHGQGAGISGLPEKCALFSSPPASFIPAARLVLTLKEVLMQGVRGRQRHARKGGACGARAAPPRAVLGGGRAAARAVDCWGAAAGAGADRPLGMQLQGQVRVAVPLHSLPACEAAT